MSGALTLTPDAVARGLIAAARTCGVDPLQVYGGRKVRGAGRARQMAAAAIASGRPARDKRLAVLAAMLQVHPTTLTPAGLARAGITTDHLLDVVEAMRGGASPQAASIPEPEPAPAPSAGSAPRFRFRDAEPQGDASSVSPSKLRFARRYRAAGWSVRSIAGLFDLDPADLKAALAEGRP